MDLNNLDHSRTLWRCSGWVWETRHSPVAFPCLDLFHPGAPWKRVSVPVDSALK